ALRVQSASEVRNSGHSLYLTHELPGNEAKCGIGQKRIHDPGYSALDSHGPVEAKPGSIQELRIKDVLLMEREELTPRYDVCQQRIKWIRLDDFRVVAHKRAGDAVSRRELVIEFSGEVVFRCNLLPCKAENSGIPTAQERSIR